LRREVEAKGWEEERLKVMILQAVAHYAHGEKEQAVGTLGGALALAEPGGILRTFVDEGSVMAHLLNEIQSGGVSLKLKISPNYFRQLLEVFPDFVPKTPKTEIFEPLSKRELEVLRYLKTELSGPEIAQELSIALSTFQSHTKNIYSKFNVNGRMAAVIKAEDLNLI
jgi:LuxR family maltose regulon positive regulatory protein